MLHHFKKQPKLHHEIYAKTKQDAVEWKLLFLLYFRTPMFINPGRSTMLAEAKLGNLNICQIHSICFYLATLYIFIQHCSISHMTF